MTTVGEPPVSTSLAGPVPALERPVDAAGSRPTTPLSIVQLLRISAFWFAMNAIWGGFEIFQQKRTVQIVGSETAPLALGVMELVAMPIAALMMPIAGSLSDYTTTRWGRRKPYILVGALTTGIALVGLALSQQFVVLAAFFVLLQFTSNLARGPFAGLVPDLVPERQVGLASGLMGLMITFGLVGGYGLVSLGYLLDEDFTLPMIALGGLVAAAGIGTVLWVPDGPPGKDRQGRGWGSVARETFGTDILRERSYVFLLGSRFFMMMAIGLFLNLNVLFFENTFGLTGPEQGQWVFTALVVSVVATAIGTLPGARISDRIGRKPVIFGAATGGAVGMAIVALAPSVELVLVGFGLVALVGGAFLAVDWALMTEIIPKASAGRYMGMSNIVEATNGPLATTLGGGLMWAVGLAAGLALGSRIAMAAGVVLFALGALLLVPVREPGRERAEPARDAAGA